MKFTVTILGSGSAIPTSRRNPTSQYILCCNRKILIDCAEGTQMQLRKMGIKMQRIEHICISHLHGDHYFGLVGLLSTMHLLGRVTPINIYGPEALEKIIRLQLEAGGARLAYPLIFQVLPINGAGEIFNDGKISIAHFPLKHKIETHGFVIQELVKERTLLVEKAKKAGALIEHYAHLKKGHNVKLENGVELRAEELTLIGEKERKYAYCSDTAYTESVVPFIHDVDVLYHEATFIEEMKDRATETKHSTAKEAATIAVKSGAKKLLIGHLSARYDNGEAHLIEAKSIFDNSFVVEDGDIYEI